MDLTMDWFPENIYLPLNLIVLFLEECDIKYYTEVEKTSAKLDL